MIQGLFIAVQGMTSLTQKQEQIANNLANINTTGYKQSGLFAQSYQKYLANDQLQPYATNEIKTDEVFIDYSEGPMRSTGAPLDCMIRGSGFFQAMTPQGLRYTRNGSFSLDNQGFLVTPDGSRVMGKEGFIRIESNNSIRIRINEVGQIFQGDQQIETLNITDFKKPYRLTREGNSFYRPLLPDNPPIESPGYSISQGNLEGSNVSPIKSMVDMISTFRNYEADQKALIAQNETLEKAVREVGKVG